MDQSNLSFVESMGFDHLVVAANELYEVHAVGQIAYVVLLVILYDKRFDFASHYIVDRQLGDSLSGGQADEVGSRIGIHFDTGLRRFLVEGKEFFSSLVSKLRCDSCASNKQ